MKKNIFMLFGVLLLSAVAFAQPKALSLKLNKVSVKSAMESLSEQSGYTFFYQVGEVDTSKSVSLNAGKLEEAIEQILVGQDVRYEIQGNTIVVSKKHQQSTLVKENNSEVGGVVVDSQNAPIVGVVVMIVGSNTVAITDSKGHFEIAAQPNDVLEFSSLGYTTRQEKVGSRTQMRITLADDVLQMEEVVVVVVTCFFSCTLYLPSVRTTS